LRTRIERVAELSASLLACIQPIVLVGGKSARFGRDKLREPMSGAGGGAAEWLVDRPIRVLREVFGRRVAAVGECDPEVAARADLVIVDAHPGAGPIGGIVSALAAVEGDVLVLSGDLPRVNAGVIRSILVAATAKPEAWAVLAASEGRIEPCIGMYKHGDRGAAVARLRERLASGRRSLHDALPADRVVLVEVDASVTVNANTPEALRGLRA
jgi:molybdopterin-guanine dinucleotide biosynthesis protein A